MKWVLFGGPERYNARDSGFTTEISDETILVRAGKGRCVKALFAELAKDPGPLIKVILSN